MGRTDKRMRRTDKLMGRTDKPMGRQIGQNKSGQVKTGQEGPFTIRTSLLSPACCVYEGRVFCLIIVLFVILVLSEQGSDGLVAKLIPNPSLNKPG
jgi:hypothetical protein